MDFDFSDDQEQLRDAVRKWVDKGYDFERRRGIANAGGFSREAYGELAELGLTGLYVPEADGGLGMGPVEAMVVMEELGRGIVTSPGPGLISGAVLANYADAGLKADWLPRIASGEALVVLAHQERRATASTFARPRPAPAAVATPSAAKKHSARRRPGRRLPGAGPARRQASRCSWSSAARRREHTRLQHAGRRPRRRAEPGAGPPVTPTAWPRSSMRWTSASPRLRRGRGRDGQDPGRDGRLHEPRKQFGVVIASFQALRHRVADMKMQLELARSMSYYATLKLNAPVAERRAALARAKVQLGQSMRFVGQQAVQLHGGIGVTDEYIGSHYFKKLTQLEMTFGDSLHHLGEVSARMQDTAGVFA
jgi:alkylation response protein AidB-like acyl-CoA dehydrogenase